MAKLNSWLIERSVVYKNLYGILFKFLQQLKMRQKVCRTCGKNTNKERSLNIFERRNQNTLEHIKLLTGVLLENCTKLPDLLCMHCQTRVKQAISFRQRCLEVQRELLESLDEKEHLKVPEVYGGIFKQEDNFDHSEIRIQIERIDDGDASPNGTSYINLESLLSESEINEEEHNDDDISYGEVDYIIYETDEDVNEKPDRKSSPQNPKTRRKRRKPGESNGTFVCEECGNNVKGRMAFILHCKRHRGVKEYECEFCQDRFCTQAELKRHVRKHTGEKPFECRHCSRSFSDYSTRLKHERTHTNERPFACRECKSAFTTAYILKNHMLVHTGEKAFRCNLCDKSFSRDTHLTTHYRSNAHKRNLQKDGIITSQDSEEGI
ncbi:transcription factor Ouib [Drosophila rhopaloa]|uniref:Transcription factor Ouib n=2 Tax=Drosophila rhopaloa TaxID=1041015 RepID=A0ABM5HHT8_DRORH|nr:transcription factor Ouib [Drosophila rhopaloa]